MDESDNEQVGLDELLISLEVEDQYWDQDDEVELDIERQAPE